MPHKKISLWEAISSPANFPNYDSRTGLGYGTQTGFHSPRQSSVSYPYIEEDDFQEEENEQENEESVDDENIDTSIHKFFNKIGPSIPYDPYAQRKTDRSYYYGSNTPTGMFAEAIAMNRSKGSISPKPDLYKKKQAVSGDGYVGASIRPFQTIIHNQSTTHGWSKSSYDAFDYFENEDDETIENIRKIVRFYHKMNLRRE
jgi:hypothetical protein